MQNLRNTYFRYIMVLAIVVLSTVSVLGQTYPNPLTWSWTAGFKGSDPRQGGDFYMYHPNSGKFFASTGTKTTKDGDGSHDKKWMTMLSYANVYGTGESFWTVAPSGGDYTIVNHRSPSPYYFHIKRVSSILTCYYKLTDGVETTSIFASSTNSKAYKVGRYEYFWPSEYWRLLTYKSGSFVEFSSNDANSRNVYNDWIFVSKKEFESTFPYYYQVSADASIAAAKSSVSVSSTGSLSSSSPPESAGCFGFSLLSPSSPLFVPRRRAVCST